MRVPDELNRVADIGSNISYNIRVAKLLGSEIRDSGYEYWRKNSSNSLLRLLMITVDYISDLGSTPSTSTEKHLKCSTA